MQLPSTANRAQYSALKDSFDLKQHNKYHLNSVVNKRSVNILDQVLSSISQSYACYRACAVCVHLDTSAAARGEDVVLSGDLNAIISFYLTQIVAVCPWRVLRVDAC